MPRFLLTAAAEAARLWRVDEVLLWLAKGQGHTDLLCTFCSARAQGEMSHLERAGGQSRCIAGRETAGFPSPALAECVSYRSYQAMGSSQCF